MKMKDFEQKQIVGCIITNDKGEFLLQKKTLNHPLFPGLWSLFGGEAESDDFVKEIKRELIEEIGFSLPVKFCFDVNWNNQVDHIFRAKLNDLSKISIREGAGVSFFAKKELKNLKFIPGTKKALEVFNK
ncbi:MAG: NUDIX hydrolase [Nanoarchaeota archaeon]|nr:NUDIX hydrolase [Nanoarchaeota archaeon]